jgi:hypothetical protein
MQEMRLKIKQEKNLMIRSSYTKPPSFNHLQPVVDKINQSQVFDSNQLHSIKQSISLNSSLNEPLKQIKETSPGLHKSKASTSPKSREVNKELKSSALLPSNTESRRHQNVPSALMSSFGDHSPVKEHSPIALNNRSYNTEQLAEMLDRGSGSKKSVFKKKPHNKGHLNQSYMSAVDLYASAVYQLDPYKSNKNLPLQRILMERGLPKRDKKKARREVFDEVI